MSSAVPEIQSSMLTLNVMGLSIIGSPGFLPGSGSVSISGSVGSCGFVGSGAITPAPPLAPKTSTYKCIYALPPTLWESPQL